MGPLPIEGREEVKRTNEIKTTIPLLEAIDVESKDVTVDALLAQRGLANYLVKRARPITILRSRPTNWAPSKIWGCTFRTGGSCRRTRRASPA